MVRNSLTGSTQRRVINGPLSFWGRGCIEWCPVGHRDWGKESKGCLLSVKMTAPWTRLQILEKTWITFKVTFTKEMTAPLRIGGEGEFHLGGHTQTKQTSCVLQFNYDKFQISDQFPSTTVHALEQPFHTVILIRKIECKVILRFTRGKHNRDEGKKEGSRMQGRRREGETRTFLIHNLRPKLLFFTHTTHTKYTFWSLMNALWNMLHSNSWLMDTDAIPQVLCSDIWFSRTIFLNILNRIIRHSDPVCAFMMTFIY